ncbi:AzlC family ABC transporter permease [uncultured Roseovarius sp.]|uniref:AzlC family ABC transporter permease n=1 Tax=Roseovarius pacificus TaxID=337701 RepID=UPI002598AF0C|nr:AzlC family ABC transporter permease [uncultured Roseovarius sp.]
MPTESSKSIFFQGVRDSAPFILVMVPFSILFGVVAAEAGLNVFEAVAFSFLVIAGAAQFTAIELMRNDAPTLIVLISALAVNLRMAMYSASLVPYLGKATLMQRAWAAYFIVDQTYACSILKFDARREWTVKQRLIYFFGVAAPVCPPWYLFTGVGAVVGQAIPESFALDFAIPIMFLALIGPMMRTRAHVAAGFVSVATALIFAFLPYNLGLLVAGLLGMMAGAQVELIDSRRAERSGS